MNGRFNFLVFASFALARPLVKVKVKEIEQTSTTMIYDADGSNSPSPNKCIVAAFLVAASIAVCSLIALAIAVRKIKKLTKKTKKSPRTEMEAQTLPPPETENSGCQSIFMGEDVGIQTLIPNFVDVGPRRKAPQ